MSVLLLLLLILLFQPAAIVIIIIAMMKSILLLALKPEFHHRLLKKFVGFSYFLPGGESRIRIGVCMKMSISVNFLSSLEREEAGAREA